jgi:AcrR family transcriptional regulator
LRLFAEAGYESTSIEAVLKESKVSRGALYHHFENKSALFSAVLEVVEQRVAQTVGAAAQGLSDPAEALRAGSLAWLRLAADDPAVRRIVLIDAPSVVGWEAWREIDGRYALGLLKAALGVAAAGGLLAASSVDLYAHLLLAVLIEAALVVARSDDSAKAIEAGQEATHLVIAAFIDRVAAREKSPPARRRRS